MPELKWAGKEKVTGHHLDVPFRTLRHVYTFTSEAQAVAARGEASGEAAGREAASEAGGNKIIHGDNLGALKALLPEYEGRVKCIYIDPPYNTGNENWIYNDNVNKLPCRRARRHWRWRVCRSSSRCHLSTLWDRASQWSSSRRPIARRSQLDLI